MFGLVYLFLASLLLMFAIWVGGEVNQHLWRNKAKSGLAGIVRPFSRVMITALIFITLFLLPFVDQLIAYPKWQQLCSTTSDFEWGPGMDAEKAYGREVAVVKKRVTSETIFPGVKIEYLGQYVYDAKTEELIFKKPHYAYTGAKGIFHIPTASGDDDSIFLSSCNDISYIYYYSFRQNSYVKKWSKKLNLTVVKYKN